MVKCVAVCIESHIQTFKRAEYKFISTTGEETLITVWKQICILKKIVLNEIYRYIYMPM